MSQGETVSKEPVELEVEAYMDRLKESEDAPKDDERREYYRNRYKFIKDQAKRLQLEREELEATKSKNREQVLTQIRQAFTENYQSRKAIVTELRKLGEKIEDSLIPNSAV